jgi:hydrocephalus-inducing protein
MDHPHRDMIELIGELCFPNLTFETQNLNFGSILCETTKKMNIKIQNVSEMSFSYQWNFLEEEMDNFSINEVFDILPLSGYLQPGESENVEFIYNSVANHKGKAIAVCHVEGGPDYEVTLEGDQSLIAYKISSNLLEFGEVRFCDWVQKEFYIENTGKV